MRRGKAALSALVAASSVLGLMAVGSAAARVESAAAAKDVYIVQMIDPPAVAYESGIAGLNATKPAKGEKIDPGSADVKKYAGYLNGRHDKAISVPLNRSAGFDGCSRASVER